MTGSNSNKDHKVADKDWNREIEILKLLSRNRKITDIAGQYRISDKSVRRLRDRATKYPIETISTLPLEVQRYIARKTTKSRPLLWAMLFHKEELKSHWEELSIVAKQLEEKLLFLRENTFNMMATVHEMAVENDDYELLRLLELPLGEQLLAHIKHELPEVRAINNWDELRIRDISKNLLTTLSLMSQQRRFEGMCEVCKKLVQSSSNE